MEVIGGLGRFAVGIERFTYRRTPAAGGEKFSRMNNDGKLSEKRQNRIAGGKLKKKFPI